MGPRMPPRYPVALRSAATVPSRSTPSPGTLDAEQATHGYALSFQTFVGDTGYLYVKNGAGETLSAWLIDSLGKVATTDVHLPPGTYTIEVPADSAGGTPYVLAMQDQGLHPATPKRNRTRPSRSAW